MENGSWGGGVEGAAPCVPRGSSFFPIRCVMLRRGRNGQNQNK